MAIDVGGHTNLFDGASTANAAASYLCSVVCIWACANGQSLSN